MKLDREESYMTKKSSFVSDDIETGTRQPSREWNGAAAHPSPSTSKKRQSVMFIEDVAFDFIPTGGSSAQASGFKAHQGLRQSMLNGDEVAINEIAIVTRDFALVLGMERTLFAALNNCWIIAVAGIALITTAKDERMTQCGSAIIVLSAIGVVIAVYMHCVRVWQIRNDKALHFNSTLLWGGWAGALSMIALVSRMYFK